MTGRWCSRAANPTVRPLPGCGSTRLRSGWLLKPAMMRLREDVLADEENCTDAPKDGPQTSR